MLSLLSLFQVLLFFFFNDTATTEIYTLSLHDALPICASMSDRHLHDLFVGRDHAVAHRDQRIDRDLGLRYRRDRKSTRLNSSHLVISYAVFCLKKKII